MWVTRSVMHSQSGSSNRTYDFLEQVIDHVRDEVKAVLKVVAVVKHLALWATSLVEQAIAELQRGVGSVVHVNGKGAIEGAVEGDIARRDGIGSLGGLDQGREKSTLPGLKVRYNVAGRHEEQWRL